MMRIMVDKSLIQKYGKKVSPKQGDRVKVMRGDFKGKEGKVIAVDRKRGYLYIDTILRKDARGKETHIGVHHSNVKLMNR